MTWFKGRRDLEVPPKKVKEIDETFTPAPEYQAMLTAPPLPQPIADRLQSAPKYLAKVPKLVNDMLLRCHKELFVAIKPLLEVSMFSYIVASL